MNTTQKSDALRLADKYEVHGFLGDHRLAQELWCRLAATELRRQHARIAELEADRKTYNSIGEETIQQLHDVLLYLQNETMKLEAAYGSNFKKEATEKARAATKKMKEAVYAIKNIDAEIKRQEAELQRLREEKAAIAQEEKPTNDQFLMDAVLNCPHSITAESVTLHFSQTQKDGYNALSQLRHRLADYDLAARQRELQLLSEIEALERLALANLKQREGEP